MSSIIKLGGCKSRPLISYLKSLGIIRLLAEQKDQNVRGFWRENTFQIKTKSTKGDLVKFFLNEYAPSPLFGPWGARSGFYPKSSEKSAREALVSLIDQPQDRFDQLRSTAEAVYETKASLGYEKENPPLIKRN